MLFRQLFDEATYTYTYLVAEKEGGKGLLIDPVLEKQAQYEQLLKELDISLEYVLETHVHADHITAAGKLQQSTGCKVIQGEKSAVKKDFVKVTDGDVIELGELSLKVLYTPGHTDDSYCFLMEDLGQKYLFSGDTLFIRGTGRTDFQHGDAGALYDSIFEKLLSLPEDTLVYPGHDYKGMTMTTIGEEKRFNPRLLVANKEEFIALMEGLNLPDPKLIQVAVPANLELGLVG